MIVVKNLMLIFMGFGFGFLAAAGVFTVFTAVGLVARFAGKTHTNKYVFFYENMIVLGSIMGVFFSIWTKQFAFGIFLKDICSPWLFDILRNVLMIVFGGFAGMFVGCLALAIAEMLESIPILTRRIGLKNQLSIILVFVALGKIVGSIIYFILKIKQ